MAGMAVNPVASGAVGFTPGPLTGNFDIASQQAQIARLRDLAAALQTAALQNAPTLTDAGAFKVANWGDSIAQMAKAWAAGKNMDAANQQESTLAKVIGDRRNSISDQFNSLMTGKPGTPGTLSYDSTQDVQNPEDWNAGMLPHLTGRQESVPPNPLQAAMTLSNSGFPDMQQTGQTLLKAVAEGWITPKDVLNSGIGRHALTTASVQQSLPGGATGPVDTSVLKPQGTSAVVEGNIQDTTPITQQTGDKLPPPQFAGQTFKPMQPATATVPAGQYSEQSGKFESPPGSTQLPEMAGDRAGMEKAREGQVEMLKDRFVGMQKAIPSIPTLLTAYNMIDDAYTGQFANQKLFLQKAAQALHLAPDNPAVQSSEALRAYLARSIISQANVFKGRNTNNEIDVIAGANAADLAKDPATMKWALATTIAEMKNQELLQKNLYSDINASDRSANQSLSNSLKPYVFNLNLSGIPEDMGIQVDPRTGMYTTSRMGGLGPQADKSGLSSDGLTQLPPLNAGQWLKKKGQ